jgi:hypothetical protein
MDTPGRLWDLRRNRLRWVHPKRDQVREPLAPVRNTLFVVQSVTLSHTIERIPLTSPLPVTTSVRAGTIGGLLVYVA